MKVMLIEDDHTMVSLLSMLLEIEGFSVVIPPQPDQNQIITAIQQEQPSLVMMDVNLAHLNGLELLRQVRKDPDLHSVRVLMCSGLDYRKECSETGADGFIMKPYMPSDLIAQIRSLLNASG
jgi:DNA-binding response OmpR family regulator